MEQTLSIIKPDAVSQNTIGEIIAQFEKEGLQVIAAKMLHLSKSVAKEFYAIHKDRPFFEELVEFMCSGPVLVQVLEDKDAVVKNRKIMGATNPKEAESGSIRAKFGTSIENNAVHGSDSLENAKTEVSFFFKKEEIHHRN